MVRACVLMVAVLGAGVAAQDAAEPVEREVVPAPENAALVYWAGWYWLAEHRQTLMIAGYDEHGLFVPEGQTEDEIITALKDASRVMDIVIRASKMEHCDFGSRPEHALDEDRSPSEYYLNVARETSGIVALDAGYHLERNWSEEGTERLAALFRMAEHIGRAEMTSPSLVGVSVFHTAARYTELFQDKFSDKDRRVLAEALDRFPSQDTFRLMTAVRTDTAISAQRLANRIRTREMREWDLEELGIDGVLASVEVDSDSKFWNTRFSRLARARLFRDAMRIAEVGDKYAGVWGDEKALDSLYDDLESGVYGVFARDFTIMYGKLVQVDTESRAKLDALRAWANGETEILEFEQEAKR